MSAATRITPSTAPSRNLEGEPSLERLEVVQDRFDLSRANPTSPSNRDVPRALIADDRERDFGSDIQSRMQPSAKSPEQPLLTGVADRIAAHVGVRPDVAPDRTADGRKLHEGRVPPSVDDAGDGPPRHASDAADRLVAQSGRPLRPPELGEDAALVVIRDAQSTRDATVPACHRARMPSVALLTVN